MGAGPVTRLKYTPLTRHIYVPEVSQNRHRIILGPLTLHYDPCCGLDGSFRVAGIAVVLPLVREGDVLNEESSRAGDCETGILWQRRARAKGPADARLGVPRDPTLQGDTFPNQHFSVLWLDHKSGLGCNERRALGTSSAACSLMGLLCNPATHSGPFLTSESSL